MMLKYLGLAYILTWWSGIKAETSPIITAELPEITADIGEDARLTCVIKNGPDYPLFWMRLDENGTSFPISSGPALLISDKRFSLEHDVKSGTYSLSIRDVQLADVATYQCQVVISLHKMITDDVKLLARIPPIITDDPATRRIRVKEGDEAKLSCKAKGHPSPMITWRKENGQVLPSGQDQETVTSLVIPNVKREDRGSYVCVAHNGIGHNASRVVNLDIEFPPTIEVPQPRTAQASDYDARLICVIKAFPAPTIFWKKDEELITFSDSHQISHFASQGDVTTSTLKINDLEEEQFGSYKCEASNRHGSASQYLELYKSTIPICPPVCGDMDIFNDASTIHHRFKFLMISLLWLLIAFIN